MTISPYAVQRTTYRQERQDRFAKLIRRIRICSGLDRKDIVTRSGLPYTSLAGLESGDRGLTEKTATRLAAGMGVDALKLIALWKSVTTANQIRTLELTNELIQEANQARIARENGGWSK